MSNTSAPSPVAPIQAQPRVLVVIVNYKTAGLTIDCLRSLAPEVVRIPSTQVVVGDNLSPDNSLRQLRSAVEQEGWGAWVSVLPLDRNGGFSFGNNRVIERALAAEPKPDLIWLLNPDTLVLPGGLVNLVEFMRQNPACGIAGSRLEDPDGTHQTAAFRFPGMLSEIDSSVNVGVLTVLLENYRVWLPESDHPVAVDWVSGASMMVRREVFETVGLLDERYFMYFEELDCCLRARKAGIQAWQVPASRVVHLVGQASGLTGEKTREKRRPAYWFRSRRWFLVKNHGAIGAIAADLCRILGTAVGRGVQALRGRPNRMPPCYLRDLMRHSVFIAGFRP